MEIELWALLDDSGRAPASAVAEMLAVDPGIREPEFPRLHVIVKKTLRHVQDAPRRGAEILIQMLQHVFEITRIRLVAADILRSVDRVEFDTEFPVRGRKP